MNLLKQNITKIKYIDDKYFMIIIENIAPFDFKKVRNDIYVISKDENNILLPINKYIRNSFNLLEKRTIFQKYFFEKDNIANNEFILEFSSNYKNIKLTFNNLIEKSAPIITGGFKRYLLSINSVNSDDSSFNIEISPSNNLLSENTLTEVNIVIKYYNKEKKTNIDEISDKNFKLEKINSLKKYCAYNYNLIINNNNKINIPTNDLNYIYYLRLNKKANILNNEELNTIASISSNLFYINKFNFTEPNKEILFNLNNLENNKEYIASFFIKVENRSEGEEIYYSITYEFNTKIEKEKSDNNDDDGDSDSSWLIVFIFIFIVLSIIAAFIFFIFYRKIRIRNRNLEDKVDAISLSNGINEDLVINFGSDKTKGNEDYENAFI